VGQIGLILAYGVFGYVFLLALRLFQVRSFAGLFLAAAVFGFLVEGSVVPVLYMTLPFSIAWTSLGWHALFTVSTGFFLYRRVMSAPFPAAVTRYRFWSPRWPSAPIRSWPGRGWNGKPMSRSPGWRCRSRRCTGSMRWSVPRAPDGRADADPPAATAITDFQPDPRPSPGGTGFARRRRRG